MKTDRVIQWATYSAADFWEMTNLNWFHGENQRISRWFPSLAICILGLISSIFLQDGTKMQSNKINKQHRSKVLEHMYAV